MTPCILIDPSSLFFIFIFQEEVRAIVKRRTDFEYSLRRMEMTVATYEEYLQYEFALDKLLEIRSKKLISKVEKSVVSLLRGLKTASIRHIHYIFERGLRRFPNNFELWDEAINFLAKKQSNALLDELLGKAIALHPKEPHFWIRTAEHELQHNNNIHAARVLMQRSLRINDTKCELWAAYFRLEVWNIQRALLRQQKLGISKEGMEEIVPGLVAPAMVVFRFARDAIINLGAGSEELATLFSMHNETVALPIEHLSQGIHKELVENTLPRLSQTQQQQEVLLHLIHFHLLHHLQVNGYQLDSIEKVLVDMVGGIGAYLESLIADGTWDSSVVSYLIRWVMRVSRKIAVAAVLSNETSAEVSSDSGSDDDGDDDESESSDDGEEDEDDDDKDLNDEEKAAKKEAKKAQKAFEKENRRKTKLTPLARRLKMVVHSAYTNRGSLLHFTDLPSVSSSKVSGLQGLVEAFLKSKDGKKWKKDMMAQLTGFLERLELPQLSVFSDAGAVVGMAVLQWLGLVLVFGWQKEKTLESKWRHLLNEVSDRYVAGAPLLQQWQDRVDRLANGWMQVDASASLSSSSSSSKPGDLAAHSGPRFQLVHDLQTWAAVALSFLSLPTTLASSTAAADALRRVLPKLSPWLVQPLLPSSGASADAALLDPTLLSSVSSTPGSSLLLRLTGEDEALYHRCVESIVQDSKIVSALQREYWLMRVLQESMPTTEEWILLTDAKDVLQRWQQFTAAFQKLLEQYRRHPHLFAHIELASVFHRVFQNVDVFFEHWNVDVATLVKPRKTKHASLGASDIEAIATTVDGMTRQAVLLCSSDEAILERFVTLLRAQGKHEEANHAQFKRRRLV